MGLQLAALGLPFYVHVSSVGNGEGGGFTEGAARDLRETEVRQRSVMQAMLSYVHAVRAYIPLSVPCPMDTDCTLVQLYIRI